MSIPTPAYGHELRHPKALLAQALADAKPTPFWLDTPDKPAARQQLQESISTDLLIIGGGYCGLWTAIRAKERDPNRRVVLIEAERIGWAASGRNGGFCETSLTHGPENGLLHFADEVDTIEQLARENFRDLADTLDRYGIDAEWEETGVLTVATEPHQVAWMHEAAKTQPNADVLEGEALRAYGDSPVYRAGVFDSEGTGYVHPAKLAWGLATIADRLGVTIYEHTRARKLRRADHIEVDTEHGTIAARRVALATNAFPSLLPAMRLFTVPIYDYVLMTQPLSDAQLESIGWTGRHGITDSSREFHYYRKTADNRILFGGYDAVYHRGGKIRPEYDQRPETFERLADHFFTTFPQLVDVTFSHRWGGVIDMSTQLVAFHGSAIGGRVAYSAGYTGLGVGATRFGADTMLDLLEGADTARTRLKMARRLPVPIPPEPLANPLIQMMRSAVARSDANGGKDGPLLKLAGAFGVGFDS